MRQKICQEIHQKHSLNFLKIFFQKICQKLRQKICKKICQKNRQKIRHRDNRYQGNTKA